jgi:hypothetical protein
MKVIPANHSNRELPISLSTTRVMMGRAMENESEPRSAPVEPNMIRKPRARKRGKKTITIPINKKTAQSAGKIK